MELQLPGDFKDFLKLLTAHGVEYLLVGGYAVSWHGYARATEDIDIWIAVSPSNAKKVTAAVREFGFETPDTQEELFLSPKKIIRMGMPPVRIEVLTGISGVEFDDCYERRLIVDIDGVMINIINLEDLKTNKRASGRHRDLDDLEHLPMQ